MNKQNDMVDEKQALREMLDTIVILWDFEAPIEEMNGLMLKAKTLLEAAKTEA
jgi:hypothetical protein